MLFLINLISFFFETRQSQVGGGAESDSSDTDTIKATDDNASSMIAMQQKLDFVFESFNQRFEQFEEKLNEIQAEFNSKNQIEQECVFRGHLTSTKDENNLYEKLSQIEQRLISYGLSEAANASVQMNAGKMSQNTSSGANFDDHDQNSFSSHFASRQFNPYFLQRQYAHVSSDDLDAISQQIQKKNDAYFQDITASLGNFQKKMEDSVTKIQDSIPDQQQYDYQIADLKSEINQVSFDSSKLLNDISSHIDILKQNQNSLNQNFTQLQQDVKDQNNQLNTSTTSRFSPKIPTSSTASSFSTTTTSSTGPYIPTPQPRTSLIPPFASASSGFPQGIPSFMPIQNGQMRLPNQNFYMNHQQNPLYSPFNTEMPQSTAFSTDPNLSTRVHI